MIDLKEMRSEWQKSRLPAWAKSYMYTVLDKLEAAEKVCEAAINEIVAFEGQKCTCFPEMLNGYCNECSNRKICKALKKWQGVK